MKYLLLIDRKFPYKKGEAFLENEIEYLSAEFDQIFVFPIDSSKKDHQTREIKFGNVSTFQLNNHSNKFKKIVDTLLGLKYFPKNFRKSRNVLQSLEISAVDQIVKDRVSKIIKILNSYSFNSDDEVYIYSYWLYTTAYIALELKKFFVNKSVKSLAVSRAHRFDIYEETRWNKIVPYQREMVNNLDRVYSISENGMQYLKSKYPKISEKIGTSRLGTIDRGLSPKDTKTDIFHILSVSWIEERKRIDLIIKCLRNLDLQGKKILWTHIGSGSKEKKIKKLARKYLKETDYEFLGAKQNLEVYEYYKNNSIDVFLNVSSSEGIPVSIMEASSFGVPVIATDVGGTSEIINNGENGYLLARDFEINDLQMKLKKLAALDDKEAEAYRFKARKLWEEKYQSKQNYESFVQSIQYSEFKKK
jgi:glycosyltransferase involved in cell wall biosynthesis